mmetsp:Transcript_83866/g.251339  ORF Transcript_83866/g.251339 Transcript_83866/m.251339 type:complete len:242 (+) Transcript_83866:1669-2394(+)
MPAFRLDLREGRPIETPDDDCADAKAANVGGEQLQGGVPWHETESARPPISGDLPPISAASSGVTSVTDCLRAHPASAAALPAAPPAAPTTLGPALPSSGVATTTSTGVPRQALGPVEVSPRPPASLIDAPGESRGRWGSSPDTPAARHAGELAIPIESGVPCSEPCSEPSRSPVEPSRESREGGSDASTALARACSLGGGGAAAAAAALSVERARKREGQPTRLPVALVFRGSDSVRSER